MIKMFFINLCTITVSGYKQMDLNLTKNMYKHNNEFKVIK